MIDCVFLIEKVRMVFLGIEVILDIFCLVRGYIGCNKIIKFEGCYYGYSDFLLIKVGLGVVILGLFDLLGVFEGIVKNIIMVLYNDLDLFKLVFEKYGDDIVGVIVELVVGNMGVVFLVNGFL